MPHCLFILWFIQQQYPRLTKKKQKKNFISLNSSVEFMVKSWKIAIVATISYENIHIFGWYIHIIIIGMMLVYWNCVCFVAEDNKWNSNNDKMNV